MSRPPPSTSRPPNVTKNPYKLLPIVTNLYKSLSIVTNRYLTVPNRYRYINVTLSLLDRN